MFDHARREVHARGVHTAINQVRRHGARETLGEAEADGRRAHRGAWNGHTARSYTLKRNSTMFPLSNNLKEVPG